MIAALVGNPNCGKTTLFNHLTGQNQHIGNFPGVTVEKKEGQIQNEDSMILIDLPGTYSLNPFTLEEKVTIDYLMTQPVDCIINIVDATNPQRGLYLTLQLRDLNIPMIVLFNMIDEVNNNHETIDFAEISKTLRVPVYPLSASKGIGIESCMEALKHISTPFEIDYGNHTMSHLQKDLAVMISSFSKHPRHDSAMIMQGQDTLFKELDPQIQNKINQRIQSSGQEDLECALITFRYQWIEKLCDQTCSAKKMTKETKRSLFLDQFLTNRFLSIPLFFFFLMLIYGITFGPIGSFLSEITVQFLDLVRLGLENILNFLSVSPWLQSLVLDGIFTGVSSILSFLPSIMLLFLCLSFLEEIGYMARVAFILDAPMKKIGLCGKSIVCLLMGMGCSVPAILSTRTLKNEKERKITVLLVPFVSCSAKLPVYTLILMSFFSSSRSIWLFALYGFNLLIALIFSVFLNRFAFKKEVSPTLLELPNYRFPTFKSLYQTIKQKAIDFITRACTVLLIASVLIWILQSFTPTLQYTTNIQESVLALFAQALSGLFRPLGLSDWRIVTALISGFTAKEAVLSTMSVLFQTSLSSLPHVLQSILSFPSAVAFLVFFSLYTPCIAAISAIKKEFNSLFFTLEVVLFQTSLAWLISCIFYQVLIRF